MSKLTRVFQNLFGSSGSSGDFGQFGSKAAGAPTYTKDPATIQSLSRFLTGWADAVVTGSVPELEDMNGLFLLLFYQVCYLLQTGVAEWDASTTYYIGSMVNVNGAMFVSKTDANVGNDPSSSATNWQLAAGEQAGFVKDFAGPVANIPNGYLLCDGSAISRTTYVNLFSAIGTYWGTGDGSTTFNLPNLKGVVTAGYDSTQTEFNAVGKTGGEKTHTLTPAELAAHTHNQTSVSPQLAPGGGGSSGRAWSTSKIGGESYVDSGVASQTTGGDTAHNNLQPYATVLKIIKY